jgi:enoyl-CoA hydratase
VTQSEHVSTQVRRDDADGVITVTFTRDDKLNAISREMFDAIEDALVSLESDDSARVLVIRAEGRYFTAGFDLNGMGANIGQGTDGVVRGSNMRIQYRNTAHHDLYDRFETVEKPVIFAPHGPCLGVGVEIGVSCDFRLAAESATFSLPEIANFGALPASGGISRLTRLVGPHWAKWLAMAGRTIDAQQALSIGLVHDVYPDAEFGAAVDSFAHDLVQLPREAVGLAKLAVDTAASVDRRTAREFERVAQTLLWTSPDYRERVDRFRSRWTAGREK